MNRRDVKQYKNSGIEQFNRETLVSANINAIVLKSLIQCLSMSRSPRVEADRRKASTTKIKTEVAEAETRLTTREV